MKKLKKLYLKLKLFIKKLFRKLKGENK